MKWLIAFLFFICFISTSFSSKVETLYLIFAENRIPIPIFKVDSLSVNGFCHTNTSKCLALKTLKKIKKTRWNQSRYASPAHQVCKQNKGTRAILEDSKGREYEYCLFEDKSMIDSWDLYNYLKRQ